MLAVERRIPSASRVPLVDVLLVALVLLIVAAPLIGGLPSLAAQAAPTAQEIRLQVGSGGTYLLDGHPLSQAALATTLRQARTSAPDLRLRIATADDSDYRALVGALALAERAGVRNIASETR